MPLAENQTTGGQTDRDAARPRKRSFTIAGHRTSISLEAAFWSALKAYAASEGRPVSAIIADIDARRGEGGLSSAVRVWVLKRALRGPHGEMELTEQPSTDQPSQRELT